MAATGIFGLNTLSIGPSSEGMGESSGLEGVEDIAVDGIKTRLRSASTFYEGKGAKDWNSAFASVGLHEKHGSKSLSRCACDINWLRLADSRSKDARCRNRTPETENKNTTNNTQHHVGWLRDDCRSE